MAYLFHDPYSSTSGDFNYDSEVLNDDIQKFCREVTKVQRAWWPF